MNELVPLKQKVRVFVYTTPVSMVYSFPKLCELVHTWTGAPKPESGNIFVFCNRRKTYVKALFWSGGGMCIIAKQLHEGRFNLNFEKRNISLSDLSAVLAEPVTTRRLR